MSTQRRTFLAAALSFAVALAAAVVVVAVSGPARAPLAPRTMLDLVESGCLRAQDFTACAAGIFDDYDTDWEAAAELLVSERAEIQVSPFRTWCHTVAHELGKRASADSPRFGTWSLRCEGGFIHGVLADQLGGADVDALVDEALRWCQAAADVEGVVYSCAHIVGHELWSRAGGTFELASRCSDLEHPDAAAAEQRSRLLVLCRSGVYMEHFLLPDNQQRWRDTGRAATTDELIGPCLGIPTGEGREECLAMAFPALVIASPAADAAGKGREALGRCAELDEPDRDDCVIGVIGVTFTNTPRGAEELLGWCSSLVEGLQSAQAARVRQVAISVERRTLSLDQAKAVCAAAPAVNRADCEAFVEDWHHRNVIGDDDGAVIVLGAS